MAASDYRLLAEYPKQPVVRDRNYLGLINWAGAVAIIPIPGTKPEEIWVKQRIVAERIPAQALNYIDRTMSYFLQDAATQTNIREYLNGFNAEATEVALAGQIESVILAFMPRFADIDVSDSQVAEWYAANGF